MNFFETELKKGKFMIPECISCNEVIWPPSDYCNLCFKKVKWRQSNGVGNVLEFSRKDNTFFCLAQFENKIRILGTLRSTTEPKIGQKVKLESCNVNGQNYRFSMVLI